MINKIVKKEFYIFIVLLGIIIMLIGILTSFSFSKYTFSEEFVAFRIENKIKDEYIEIEKNKANKPKEKIYDEANKDDMPSLIEIVTIKH